MLLHYLAMAVALSSWRRSDALYTSGFMDEVIFAHKLKRSAHAALGLAINCAQ